MHFMQFIFICCAQRFSFKVLYSLIFPFGNEPYRLYVRYPSDFERTSSNRLLTVATSIFHNINRVVNIAIQYCNTQYCQYHFKYCQSDCILDGTEIADINWFFSWFPFLLSNLKSKSDSMHEWNVRRRRHGKPRVSLHG